MRSHLARLVISLALVATSLSDVFALGCPPDAVRVGPTCVDKYEASVWRIPASATTLLKKALRGKATLQDLQKGGALGTTPGSESA